MLLANQIAVTIINHRLFRSLDGGEATDIHDLKTTQQELLEMNRSLEERVRERAAEVEFLYNHAPTGYHSLEYLSKPFRLNQLDKLLHNLIPVSGSSPGD